MAEVKLSVGSGTPFDIPQGYVSTADRHELALCGNRDRSDIARVLPKLRIACPLSVSQSRIDARALVAGSQLPENCYHRAQKPPR